MSSPEVPPLHSSPPAAPAFTFGGYVDDNPGPDGVPFWPRVGARLIDLVIHYVIVFGATFVLGIMVVIIAAANDADYQSLLARMQAASIWPFLSQLAGAIAFHTLCEGLHGSTPGKWMLGQVVVSETLEPCDLPAALKRSVAYFWDALFFGVIGYFAMQKSRLNQRHGDTWAKTVVSRRKNLPAESLRGGSRFALVLMLAAVVDGAMVVTGYVATLF
jgi:uncharacterized RDD family membrane protein YckC